MSIDPNGLVAALLLTTMVFVPMRRDVVLLIEGERIERVGPVALVPQAPRQQQVAPAGAVVERRRRIERLDVRARAVDERRVAR